MTLVSLSTSLKEEKGKSEDLTLRLEKAEHLLSERGQKTIDFEDTISTLNDKIDLLLASSPGTPG